MTKIFTLLGMFLVCFFMLIKDNRKLATTSSENDYSVIRQDSILGESIARGEDIYTGFCMQCHMADGKGVPGTFPPLAKSDFLLTQTEESILAVKNGMAGKVTVNGEVYNSAMPKPGLYDSEVADVMNYILNSWGNEHDGMITEEIVSKIDSN